jgi:O-antigen/teichoic acid export membrane protein
MITVAGYFTLIPFFGKEGAAIAVCLGNLATAIYVTIKAQKLYFVPYQFKRMILFSLFTIGCYVFYILI